MTALNLVSDQRLQAPTMLVRVDPRFPGAWDQCSGFLQSALDKAQGRDWTLDDMRQASTDGRAELWALVRGEEIVGAGLTCLTAYPARRVIEVLAMGTKPHHEECWWQALEQLRKIALAAGITTIIGTGRPGWAKKLKASRQRIIWELDLAEE